MSIYMISLKRPTVCIWTAVAALGCTKEDRVVELVENGNLTALNVSHTEGRRCLRVLTASLADLVAGRKATRTFDQVMEILFPGRAETVLRSNVARSLSVSVATIARLQRRGLLTQAGPVRCPVNESPRITRQSLARFVKARSL